MAEYTAVTTQTVAANQNVLFNDSVYCNKKPCILHRSGSGLVTLRGLTNQCFARFRVFFSGNLGGVVGETSLAIAINNEPVAATIMNVVPAANTDYFNVSTETTVLVPKECCVNISVINNTAASNSVQNANLIVERVA